ncbi:MAG: hypothetical protein RL490_85 [Pseudomonadota bacterium]|jgi:multidrug efflux system membrane fusion protein
MAVIALALALSACGGGEDKDAAKRKRPPQMVGAMIARTQDFAPQLVALGTVTPLQTVAVRPRAEGEIIAILFNEGDNVRAGQPLFRLDDRAARAQLAQARAQLASARATAVQARGDYDRAQQLVGQGFVSKAVLDQRRAIAGSAEAAIKGAEAQVAAAETALSFLTIHAPVSGRSGELNFRMGANVRPGDALPLVTINQLSPISVRFLVPPDQISGVRAAMAKGPLTVTARAQDAGAGGASIGSGRLAFLDNNVDPGNGSVVAKAEFANRDAMLWPGAVLNVELPLGLPAPRIVLPESAVQTGRDAPFVWAVAGNGKVAMRDVTVAGRLGGKVYLATGVAPGDNIIVDTLSKLKPGDTVRTRAGRPGGKGGTGGQGGGPGTPPRTAFAPASGVGG